MYSLRPKPIDYPKLWAELEPSVLQIINLQPISRLVWNHKFSDIYDICVAIPDSFSDKLYKSVQTCLESHMRNQCEAISQVGSEDLLKEYYRLWKIYHEGARYIHNLFGYLNKQFIKTKKSVEVEGYQAFMPFINKPDIKEIGSLALETWRTRLVEPILDQLSQLVLAAVAADREGKPVANKETVAGVIQSFVQVEEMNFGEEEVRDPRNGAHRPPPYTFYQNAFEAKFLESTQEYYTNLAQLLLAENTCSQYMEKVIEILEAEEARCKTYLHTTSVPKVVRLCQDVMISAHKEKLHAVCHDLITNEERKDLRNMYRLLKPIGSGLQVMVREFEAYVRSKGEAAVANLSGDNVPQQFVENVLQVYEKFNTMKTEVFLDDGDFAGALDKALQTVVNLKEDGKNAKASERLARFTDTLLRKSAKGLSEAEIDQKLTNAIVIFRYIEDKDIFQKFYSKMLANRLIMGQSVSMDAEESMINKLKQACGYEFTSKLSRMFTDIGLSKELQAKFTEFLNEKKVASAVTQTQPFILQAGSWPLSMPGCNSQGVQTGTNEAANFILSASLRPAIQYFEEFYTASHTGRKLTWLFHLSHGEVRLNYLDKGYMVGGTVHQMSLLLCFESQDTITVGSLATQTGLAGDLLNKNLRAIVDSGLLIAEKKDAYTPETVLTLNTTFTSKRLRFKLSSPQIQRQAEKETEHVNNTVAQDRKYYMECAIVRIMKTRKVLKHNALVNEVIEQTRGRFQPDIPFIKKSIEDLIEKLYIQRTEHNDEYQYLA